MAAIIIVLGLLSFSAKAGVTKLIVASYQIVWGDGVDLDKIDCLTLNRKIGNRIFKVDYSDDPQALEILRKRFPNKKILTNFVSCAYVLTFTINVTDTHAIKYAGHISRMLMSFGVVEKNPATGALQYDGHHFRGIYKNLYLFRNDLNAIEAFEVGVKAFVAAQSGRYAVMQISVGN